MTCLKTIRAFLAFYFSLLAGQANAALPNEPTGNGNPQGEPENLTALDSLLREQESAFPDIVHDLGKQIAWHGDKHQTEYAIVYLHGFSASRKEISPVTELLADQLAANVYYARLKGHARTADAMAEASKEDWLHDTRFAYQIGKLIGKKVIVVGTSTGATLGTWLATQPFAGDLHANIMVSPNFGIKRSSGELIRYGWGLQLAKLINGPYHSFTPQNQMHSDYWTERYPYEALVPMVQLVDQVLELDKTSITVPQLIIYSPNDQVISVERLLEVSASMQNSDITLHEFEGSSDPGQHVLAGDACSPDSTEPMVKLMSDFIASLEGSR
ncbi:MAG: alpha/beta fold hydrolase [Pseudomonadota bacterium]